eukprot:4673302-Amphidinium_carterae.4
MDTIIRTAGWLKSDEWGGEAEADGGLIMGVATLAMPATSERRNSIEIEIGCLGGLKVNPLVMDSSPCVLSAGLLVAAGFGLTWTPEALELTLPNGCKTTHRSRGNVPGIVESNVTALTSRTNQQFRLQWTVKF